MPGPNSRRSAISSAGNCCGRGIGVDAPRAILFPIVGQLPGGILTHDGEDYPIGQHGFARDERFTSSNQTGTSVFFTLVDSAETRVHFPFGFRLQVRYSLAHETLTVQTTVTNTSHASFSASLGEHPGFAWPLVAGIARDAHTIEFPEPESSPIRRIVDGLLVAESQPTPVEGRVLALNEPLFENDAIIFDRLASRSVRYTAPGAPALSITFADFPSSDCGRKPRDSSCASSRGSG